MTSRNRIAVLLVLSLLALTAACGGDSGSGEPKAKTGQCSYTEDGNAGKPTKLPPVDPAKDEPSELTLSTDRGDIKVSLDTDKAPCTVNSFISLAEQGYFDGNLCHRLTNEGIFVLQCGDPLSTGQSGYQPSEKSGPGYAFDDELVDKDPRLQPCTGQVDPQSGKEVCIYPSGTLAMANRGAGTNGSQFFLVYKDSPLGSAYTPFGTMTAAGVKVVEAIAAQGLAADGVAPKQPVTIESVK